MADPVFVTGPAAPRVSIAVRAWNEEAVIARTLESLLAQSIFERLLARREQAEVLCVPNGCTDGTAAAAAAVFARQTRDHPAAAALTCRLLEMPQPGRNHTWNAVVHSLSHPATEFLFLMDSDIVFNEPDTLFNMYAALLENPEAHIASDRAIKHIALKPRRSWFDRLSLATTDMTGTIEGQMTGQLYAIRAAVARRLWLPQDLGAPDDGFIKAVVGTDFFTRPLNPRRIVRAKNASHLYEAYTSPREVLNNQKRQMIGQTTVHVLVEYIKTLPLAQRLDLAATLQQKDQANPAWVRRLTEEHLRRHQHCWELFPDLLTFRVQRWWKLPGLRRLTHLPAMLAGLFVTLVASARAYRHFRLGEMHYWPKASRENLQRLPLASPRS